MRSSVATARVIMPDIILPDIVLVGGGLLFFALALAYAELCARL